MSVMARYLAGAVVVATLVACAPAVTPGQGSGTSAAPAAPKVLTLVGREGIIGDFPGVAGREGGGGGFAHDYLIVQDVRDSIVAHIAQEPISVEKGTWRINPDGSMDTIWKIRPNVKWHDGTPFTVEDLMFTFTAFKDPELPSRYGEALRLMTSAEIVDSLTFVVHWSQPYATANQAPALNPIPKHLMEDLYTNDKANFGDSPRFHRDLVGLGPYKIVRWESGSHIEFTRFDDYYLGRPPLDTVILKFMSDPNAILANALAGTVDMVFDKNALDVEAALDVQRRWEGTANQVRWVPTQRVISVEIQYRKEFARPQAGLTERDVRHALLHGIDRPELISSVTHGFSPLAHSWIVPTSEYYPLIEDVVPKYPYDTARAQRLLAQAGWTARGPDGILVHAATGERFEFDLWNRFPVHKDQAILADSWKALGVQANARQLPMPRDREFEARINGGQMMDQTINDYTLGRLATSDIATAANRYTSRNLGAYSNPRVDALVDRLARTIDAREAATIHRDIVVEAFTDLALLPLYFQVTPMLLKAGVTGPEGGANVVWNFHEWDKR
jgi:peptide/nickel transport system substrate-binding protein